VATFIPNMLGAQAATLLLTLNDGAGHLQIKVYGHCHKVGEAGGPGGGGGNKKVATGGLLALPEDFRASFSFKEGEEFLAHAPQMQLKTLRGPMPDVPAWKKLPPPQPDGTNPDMCSVAELESRALHRFRYAQYLKRQRTLHFEQQYVWENGPEFQLGIGRDNKTEFDYQNFNLDLGMRNVTGLKPPVLTLPVADEPLYLKPEKVLEPRKRIIDAERLLHKKFAAKPANEQEASECASVLTAKEMNLVTVYPDTMEFGNISPHVKVSKSFAVSNDNKHAIVVSLRTKSDAMGVTIYPDSQVIRSGYTAGFDVNILTDTLMEIRTQIMYKINGTHEYTIQVNARPVLVNVKMEPMHKHFTIPSTSIVMWSTDTISLINSSSNTVEFRWQTGGPGSAFSFPATEGLLEGGGMQDVAIRYTPGSQTESEETLVLKLVGGEDLLLRCTARVEPAVLRVVPATMKTLDFGDVLAGTTSSISITLKNPGQSNAVFSIEFDFGRSQAKDFPGLVITASPDKAAVPPGDTMTITITLFSKAPAKLMPAKCFLNIAVRGGPSIKMGLKALLNLPDVEVLSDELDFGEVHVGSLGRCPLKLRNISATLEACLVVDLRKYPEFKVILPEGMISTPMKISPSSDRASVPSELPGASLSPLGGGEGGTYMSFVVPANSTHTLELELAPLAIKTYAFELPLLVRGISPLDLPQQLRAKLRRVVAAEATKPRVQMSVSSANFGFQVNRMCSL
jgi:hypothetical protein